MTLLGFCKGWYTFLQLCFSAVSHRVPFCIPSMYFLGTLGSFLVNILFFISQYIYIYIYIYIYVCMYLYMYVCIYMHISCQIIGVARPFFS